MARGSIVKHVAKNGTVTYRLRVVTYYDASGRPVQKMRSFKTKRDADAMAAKWVTDVVRGTAVDPSKQTVGQYLSQWLATSVAARVRASTLDSYTRLMRASILPTIGEVPVQKLNAAQVQRLYTDLLAAGLSHRTVRYVHTVLKMAMKQAVRWRLVARNVVDDVDPPCAVRPQIAAWDQVDSCRFLAVAALDPLAALWRVALATGMRVGELRGLRWSDIDLDAVRVQVRQNAVTVGGQVLLQEPKTNAGHRNISINPDTVGALRAWRAQRPALIGRAEREAELVFPGDDGAPISLDAVTYRFQSLVRRAEVRRISFHGMRHTHATLLLAAGANIKVVSERLGHSSIQITLDTYAHVLPEMEQQAAIAIGAMLAG